MQVVDKTAAVWLLSRIGGSHSLEGDDCFAQLVERSCSDDVAMRQLVRIVRGAEAPERFDVMPESAGLRCMIAGLHTQGSLEATHSRAAIIYEAIFVELQRRVVAGEPMESDPLLDPESGLPNRLLFLDRITQAIAYAHRHDTILAVCSVRIELGELLPHRARVAREIAERLHHTIRELDTIARLGVEEFGVVLNDLHRREHADIALRKMEEILGEPFDIEDLCLSIQPRSGIAFYPADGHDATMLLDAARQFAASVVS